MTDPTTSPTKKVRLTTRSGDGHGSVEIPQEAFGPEVITRGGRTYVRKTHDVYMLATCLAVPDA